MVDFSTLPEGGATSTDDDTPPLSPNSIEDILSRRMIPYIQTPVYIDYGLRVSIQPTTFINRNFTILDTPVADVKIGMGCSIGPGVTIISVGHPVEFVERCEKKGWQGGQLGGGGGGWPRRVDWSWRDDSVSQDWCFLSPGLLGESDTSTEGILTRDIITGLASLSARTRPSEQAAWSTRTFHPGAWPRATQLLFGTFWTTRKVRRLTVRLHIRWRTR